MFAVYTLCTTLCVVCYVSAIDNGIGLAPPRGWRSWNLFHADVNDTVMRAQMKAIVDVSRGVTLASLGFNWVSMDDGWQKCNCSTPGSMDSSLPKCPNCKATGQCSWHDEKNGGRPIVDKRKFPDMKAMVAYGHSLGLKVGSYLNNCICMEGGDPPMGLHCNSPTHYQQDVDFIIDTGFDGVKIDNCGSSHNMTHWAELFNKSGKPIRIESCHTYHPNHGTPSGWPNFPVWDPPTKAKDAHCPMNFYRTGGDIGPSFSSVIGELYATVQYSDHTMDGKPDPFNRPGCWAYPDMNEIGNFNGPDPLRFDEERTNWGLYCITSSPLILGNDLSVKATMDRIWLTITNTEALEVNAAWVGHPGTLIRSYEAGEVTAMGTADMDIVVDHAKCNGSDGSVGWRLNIIDSANRTGNLVVPGGEGESARCLGSEQGPTGQNFGYNQCPPPTSHFPQSGCGVLATACDKNPLGVWQYNNQTKTLAYLSGESFSQRKCLYANPSKHVGGFYGGPVARMTNLNGCSHASTPPNASAFTFTSKGELVAGNGQCLIARRLYGAQLWAKPLPRGQAAVLVLNLLQHNTTFSLPLLDIPFLTDNATSCVQRTGATCAVRDVWEHKDLGAQASHLTMSLRSHQSAFFIVG